MRIDLWDEITGLAKLQKIRYTTELWALKLKENLA
jgi:hypothetical protein